MRLENKNVFGASAWVADDSGVAVCMLDRRLGRWSEGLEVGEQ